MAIKGYMESTLGTSEIWNGTDGKSGINNSSSDGTLLQKAIGLIKGCKHLTNEDIEAAYIQVKQITDSLTREALRAFDEGKIVLVYDNTPATRVSKALPFITLNTKGEYITYVFIGTHIKVSRDDVMTLQAPILRDLLTGAVIANGLKKNYETLSSSQYFQKTLMSIYCKFFTRIINRQYSIAPDKVTFDVVQYWVNKFFLLRILGANDLADNIEKISTDHFKYVDDMKYQEIKIQYDDAAPTTVSGLLDLIKDASPRMKGLNLMTFVSEWINYYYVPAMLAIDNVEYLMFMITTLLSGNNIISIAASDVVKEDKGIKSFRSEVLKLL